VVVLVCLPMSIVGCMLITPALLFFGVESMLRYLYVVASLILDDVVL
jgi:hypothetical protein